MPEVLPSTPSIPALTDPCGNPIPIPINLPDLIPKLPTDPLTVLEEIASLLGFALPPDEIAPPCPILLDQAAAAASAAAASAASTATSAATSATSAASGAVPSGSGA